MDIFERPVRESAYSRCRVVYESRRTTVSASHLLLSLIHISSGINDGAAAVLVMSAEKAAELGVKPMARWIGGASAGVDPKIMGVGPAYSTEKLFKKTGLGLGDLSVIEANEAFAAQSLAVGKLLGWDASKVNPKGGAISLGHPVGASGCRILVTLLHELEAGQKGLATPVSYTHLDVYKRQTLPLIGSGGSCRRSLRWC